MRYGKIFLLHFQDAFHSRGRSFVYFLLSLTSPMLLLLFWQGAIREHGEVYGVWTSSAITSYYLLIAIASSFLIVHIEEDVAFRDIKDGALVKYLLRPFSYFIVKFMEELPWRVIQGLLAIVIFLFFRFIVGIPLPIVHRPLEILLVSGVFVLAFAISYVFKMVLGLTAFWTTDFWGTLSIEEFLFSVFGGIIAPLVLYPSVFARIAQVLPFAYIVYFPVVAVEGMLSIYELLRVLGAQVAWLIILYGVYLLLWNRGIKKFSSVGQ